MSESLRPPAELKYADELAALARLDDARRPFAWALSPKMVRIFILGSRPRDGLPIAVAQKVTPMPGLPTVNAKFALPETGAPPVVPIVGTPAEVGQGAVTLNETL